MTRKVQNRTASPRGGGARSRRSATPLTGQDMPKRRLSAADRRHEILTKSIEYLPASDLTVARGNWRAISAPRSLCSNRYFPNKDALIQEIYKVVYLDQWKPAWDNAADRPQPSAAPAAPDLL